MAITEIQWQAIEKELSGLWDRVVFKLNDDTLAVNKVMISETQLGLVVYINGTLIPSWGVVDSESFRDVTRNVWRERRVSLYTKAEKSKLINKYGTQLVKKHFPNIDRVIVSYKALFKSFSTLKSQYKKLSDLEVLCIGSSTGPANQAA